MIALRPALKDYLTMRRALGYKLQRTEKLLADFIGFVDASASERVTTDLAIAWATLPAQGAMNWWAGRLTVVRRFATSPSCSQLLGASFLSTIIRWCGRASGKCSSVRFIRLW